MIPEPVHPALVHFPVVFSVLLPISALGALWAIRRHAAPHRAWALPLALAAALTGSAFVALETGEAQEERVERVVAEAPLHEHEEAAERFMLLAGILTLVAAAGLAGGTVGSASRIVATLGTLVVLAAAYQTARLGGELVYVHGAAEAWVDQAASGAERGFVPGAQEDEDGDDEGRR